MTRYLIRNTENPPRYWSADDDTWIEDRRDATRYDPTEISPIVDAGYGEWEENPVVKLRLVLEVEYETNGVSDAELCGFLTGIANHAANVGALSGESAAEVIEWNAWTEEV